MINQISVFSCIVVWHYTIYECPLILCFRFWQLILQRLALLSMMLYMLLIQGKWKRYLNHNLSNLDTNMLYLCNLQNYLDALNDWMIDLDVYRKPLMPYSHCQCWRVHGSQKPVHCRERGGKSLHQNLLEIRYAHSWISAI